jgi:hypothetical protein
MSSFVTTNSGYITTQPIVEPLATASGVQCPLVSHPEAVEVQTSCAIARTDPVTGYLVVSVQANVYVLSEITTAVSGNQMATFELPFAPETTNGAGYLAGTATMATPNADPTVYRASLYRSDALGLFECFVHLPIADFATIAENTVFIISCVNTFSTDIE